MGGPELIGGIRPFASLHAGPTTLVYKGYQPSLDRFVLLKVMRPEVAGDADLVRRFEEEARLAARVQHPNVVPVYGYGEEAGQIYLTTEYVEGQSLADLLAARRLPADLAAYILREAARGLQAAHEKGVLHRDLKPANILIANDGQVKIADFGLASLAGGGAIGTEVRGSTPYLAPELVLGEPPSERSDLFSLGATFAEMLTGRRAFPGETVPEVLDALVHADPMPLVEALAPPDLARICRRLLARTTSDRYETAAALGADLERVLRAFGPGGGAGALERYLDSPDAYVPQVVPAPLASGAEVVAPPRRRRGAYVLPVLVGLLVVAALVLVRAARVKETAGPAARREAAHEAPAGPASTATNTVAAEPADSVRGAPARSEEVPSEAPPPAVAPAPAAPALPATGTLEVSCVPWAAVWVGADSVGVTPLTAPLTLPEGTHEVRLRHPDFPEYRTRVQIGRGEAAALNVSLWSTVARVTLEVSPWAEVILDGVGRGTVPPQERPFLLGSGSHRLVLRHPTLGTLETTLTVRAGEVRTFRYNLLKEKR